MNHTLSVLVENHPGVLSRVAGLFSRRGFNIDSLAVGVTDNPHISRITIVVRGDAQTVEQVTKQLHKLIDVIKVRILAPEDSVSRELVLIKVNAPPERRSEIIQIANVFRANIIDVAPESIIVELTGDHNKIKAMEDVLQPFGIKELVRTGVVALDRGSHTVKINESKEEI
ncbi:MAG: acetolactate synthase small subunit [bacterium]|jgi:acetolactate synthase-1/3 small subunit